MTIKDICKVHYLSCVEAYFGAWIKAHIPLGALYCESFLRWREILAVFARETTTYAAFTAIPRLQDLAERLGFTVHERTEALISSKVFDAKALTLFGVKESFFTGRKAWREDHYIAVTRYTRGQVDYINQFPLEERKVSTKQFFADFNGQCLVYRQIKAYDKALFAEKSTRQAERLITQTEDKYSILSDVGRMRDAIGILRVSRRRVLDWLTWYAYSFDHAELERLRRPIEEQIQAADRAYLQLHMYLVRRQPADVGLLASIADELFRCEQQIK